MTSTTITPGQVAAATVTDDVGDEFDHIYCPCNPDIARCGCDISGAEFYGFDEDPTCVVCADLEGTICPRCGW